MFPLSGDAQKVMRSDYKSYIYIYNNIHILLYIYIEKDFVNWKEGKRITVMDIHCNSLLEALRLRLDLRANHMHTTFYEDMSCARHKF